MLPDPVRDVLPVLAEAVAAGVVLAEVVPAELTLLTVVVCAVVGCELPVSCTPSARLVKPVLSACCEAEGAVGEPLANKPARRESAR